MQMVYRYVKNSSMARENYSKINLLVKQAPNSALLSSQWLNEHGITAKLAWWYVHAGWLEKVSNKLYKHLHF